MKGGWNIKKGVVVFSFLRILPMVVIYQVQWPCFCTLWHPSGYLRSAKSVLHWCYMALILEEGGLYWPLMLVKLINFRPYFELELVSSPCHPLPRFPLLLFLPSSLLLPKSRETSCQTVATLKYTDSSHRFSGYTRTGVNLSPQNLTANPNPVV